jgi:hypothetical protein
MYYLVIKNLGVEKCIDVSKNDYYTSARIVNCQRSFDFNPVTFVRNIKIRCIESPETLIEAVVYSDET